MQQFYGRRNPRNVSGKKRVDLYFSNFFFSEFTAYKKIRSFSKLHNNLNLEIGIGNGDNIIKSSLSNMMNGFIGCDPYLKGHYKISESLKLNQQKNILHTNLPFYKLVGFLNGLFFDNIYVLFPDPWPKKRHKKRRLINNNFVNQIYKILKYNAKVILATDSHEYSKSIKTDFLRNRLFKLDSNDTSLKSQSFCNLAETSYYLKAKRLGKKTFFLKFLKIK